MLRYDFLKLSLQSTVYNLLFMVYRQESKSSTVKSSTVKKQVFTNVKIWGPYKSALVVAPRRLLRRVNCKIGKIYYTKC